MQMQMQITWQIIARINNRANFELIALSELSCLEEK